MQNICLLDWPNHVALFLLKYTIVHYFEHWPNLCLLLTLVEWSTPLFAFFAVETSE